MRISKAFLKSCGIEQLNSHRTPFPATFFNYTEDLGEFVNQRILDAHSLIEETCKSPYLAWAEILGYSRKDLPALLGMAENSCDYLVDHPDQSPPTHNIHAFCEKTGVHPAYILPNMLDPNYSCHYQILRAVAHIYKDKNLHPHDRDIARKCLEGERQRFEFIKDLNPKAYHYLVASFLNLNSSIQHSSNNPAADIELALDLWDQKLHKGIQIATARIEAEEDPYWTDDLLTASGAILYGTNRAETFIRHTIEMMVSFETSERVLKWDLLENGKWLKTSLKAALDKKRQLTEEDVLREVIEVAPLHPDFEWQSLEHECEPQDLLKHFERGVLKRVEIEKIKEANKTHLVDLDRGLEKFQAWRDSPEALNWHIPQFANYVLATRALGQQLQIPNFAPDVQKLKPSKARHAYHHTPK